MQLERLFYNFMALPSNHFLSQISITFYRHEFLFLLQKTPPLNVQQTAVFSLSQSILCVVKNFNEHVSITILWKFLFLYGNYFNAIVKLRVICLNMIFMFPCGDPSKFCCAKLIFKLGERLSFQRLNQEIGKKIKNLILSFYLSFVTLFSYLNLDDTIKSLHINFIL